MQSSKENYKVSIQLKNASLYSFSIIMGIALLSLISFYFLLNGKTLHFRPAYLNDQIGFIPVARHLIDYGHFILKDHFQGIGSVVMPGLLNIENTRLYMPGYYVFLAFFFWVFGVNNFTSILPSLLSYLGTTALIYYIANKFYGRQVAIGSSLLFIFFPFNILFAYISMSEMSVVFFSFLAFVVITLIPGKFRPFLTPLLLALPYLFRQTGTFLLIPVLAYLYDEKSVSKIWQLIVISLGSLIIFHLIDIWQSHQGLYGINLTEQLAHGHGVNYTNAFFHSSKLDHSFFYLVMHRFYDNILIFFNQLKIIFSEKNQLILLISILEVVIFILVSLKIGFSDWKKKLWFPISCGILALAVLGACFLLYITALIVLLRITLFTLPFVMIQVARVLTSANWKKVSKKQIILSYLCFTLIATFASARDLRYLDRISHEDNQFLESIHSNPNMLFVAPIELFTEYAYNHYPQLLSFVPENKQTLLLLNQKFPIGTLVVDEEVLKQMPLTFNDIIAAGLVYTDRPVYRNRYYLVFRKK